MSEKSLIDKRFSKQLSYVSDVESDKDEEESCYSSSEDEDEDEDEEDQEQECGYSDDEMQGKKSNKKSSATMVHKEDTDIFYHEIIELLKSAHKENLDPSNIILGKCFQHYYM